MHTAEEAQGRGGEVMDTPHQPKSDGPRSKIPNIPRVPPMPPERDKEPTELERLKDRCEKLEKAVDEMKCQAVEASRAALRACQLAIDALAEGEKGGGDGAEG